MFMCVYVHVCVCMATLIYWAPSREVWIKTLVGFQGVEGCSQVLKISFFFLSGHPASSCSHSPAEECNGLQLPIPTQSTARHLRSALFLAIWALLKPPQRGPSGASMCWPASPVQVFCGVQRCAFHALGVDALIFFSPFSAAFLDWEWWSGARGHFPFGLLVSLSLLGGNILNALDPNVNKGSKYVFPLSFMSPSALLARAGGCIDGYIH